jgi:hypothetical protein
MRHPWQVTVERTERPASEGGPYVRTRMEKGKWKMGEVNAEAGMPVPLGLA